MTRVFTIRAVESKTGLSQHTIRAWERRYGALEPQRTGTNRRVYGPEDVEKLSLLRTAVQSGHGIGQIARLSVAELRSLLAREGGLPHSLPVAGRAEVIGALTSACNRAIEVFDAHELEAVLNRGAALIGLTDLIDSVVSPLIESIGDRWQRGTVRIAEEHLVSAVLRAFLERSRIGIEPVIGAPTLIIATTYGQVHELGALLACVTAAVQGWRVTYLGPSLPAEEIGMAARKANARIVCLSVVYPEADPGFAEELTAIRRLVGPRVKILVGGRSSKNHEAAIDSAGAVQIQSLQTFRTLLDTLRA